MKRFFIIIFVFIIALFNNSFANMFDIIDEYEPQKKEKQ